tara:strand:- start:824 stop:1609 length:786 start_codon:yes stop_codon:yes gene_type:complete
MKDLLIRASSLGRLMSNDKDTSITEKQLTTLNGLLAKIKLTEKQAELRDALMLKRDARPQLSAGAKSYVNEVFMYKEFGIRQEISSKYIDKGNEVEELAIEIAGIQLGFDGLLKNEDFFKNNYIMGTPDVVNDEVLIDVKSSWSASTFPFFDTTLKNKMYEWQLKAYMWLTGHTESYLCYCLVPTPEKLILDEMRRVSWKRGEGAEVSIETELDTRAYFDLSKIPTEKRVKTFKVVLTDEDIEQIKEKVTLAREYYSELVG